MIGLLLTACMLGFVYGAAPGAVNTEALRRGLRGGFSPSFSVQIGALFGDLVWAIVGLTGVALVFHYLTVQIIMGITGGAFLLRMAWLSFVDARKPMDLSHSNHKEQRNFLTGIIFSLANPLGIAFWGGLGGGFASHMTSLPLVDKLLYLFLGFSVGAFVWCLGISVIVAWSRKFVGEKVLRGVYTVSSVVMAYFALDMLWEVFHTTIYPMFLTRSRLIFSE